jgi:hypothetical protein
MKTLVVYAWCFDHGALHRFQPRETPWCAGAWIHLDAYSEEAALAIKQRAWGEARFLDELTPDQQVTITGLAASRRTHGGSGPSVREAAADDRRWPLEREGE